MNPSPPPTNVHDLTSTEQLPKSLSDAPSGVGAAEDGRPMSSAAPNGNGNGTALVDADAAAGAATQPTTEATIPNATTTTSIATSSPNPDHQAAAATSTLASVAAVASAVPGRIPTPSSRTSTPPLAAATKKKFSSVSVNKEFLSKAVSPVPAPVKPRPAAAAAPTQASSSRLLSSKLTTVPSSKTSTSPKPPAAAATTAAAPSPWAKPAAPLPEPPVATPLQHPAPTRHGLPNVTMGSGQGLSGIGSAARRAWGPIGGGRAGQMARDFPTAKEVADGKRAALIVAQAEAAHNQAILAGLNEFTHLEPNAHRWDEEDDDDEVIDFGDGPTFASRKDNEHTAPDGERFAEDFDRSWPRSNERRGDGGRVLFNASSNQMEPQQHQHQQQHQPLHSGMRMMPREPREREHREPREPLPHMRERRDAPPHAREPAPHGTRQPPPHLGGGDRMLPPHLHAAPHAGPPGAASTRPSWRAQPGGDREAPPHVGEHREQREPQPRDHAREPREYREREPREPRPDMHRLPPRAPPHQQPMRPPAPPSHHSISPASTTSALPPVGAGVTGEVQAAEMHSAAEKARLRRIAEEQERDAAAERARKKARELAERFGDKTEPKSAAPAPAPAPAPVAAAPPAPAASSPIAPPPGLPKPPPPPGLGKPTPQITIATRPRPDAPAPVPGDSRSADPQIPHASDRATSWRRATPLVTQPHTAIPEADLRPPRGRRPSQGDVQNRPPRAFGRENTRDLPPHALAPTRDLPPHADARIQQEQELAAPVPSKEADWDAMLARLQAAMVKAKAGDEPEDVSEPSSFRVKQATPSRPAAIVAVAAVAPPPVPEPVAPKPSRKNKPATPKLPFLPPDYFDATEAEIPKSPPPAWRQYTVKLPKPTNRRSLNIPRWRIRAAEGPGLTAPAGWVMTFEPPVVNLPPNLSVPHMLLPQPIGRRFAKQVDTGPIVSISPRTLVMFERKPKRRDEQPAENSQTQSQPQSKPAAKPEPSQTEPAIIQEQAPSPLPPKRASRAEGKDRRFLVDGDTVVAPTDKPGVRFMVSSELDGDSLLDEVNKTTLEHMGELEDKSKAVVQERPATPPTVSPARPVATSPSSAPWAKATLAYPVTSPARGPPQHEHLKSVWDGAENNSAPSAPASAPPQPETPLYPTLTAPVTTSENNSTLKPSFSPMQPGSSAFSMRSSSLGQPGYQYPMGTGGSSPDGGMSMQYGLMGRTSGNGFQQGVWSSTFGSSMATPTFYNKDQKQHAQQQQAQQQQFSQSGGKDSSGANSQHSHTQQQQGPYSHAEYRYSQQQAGGGNGFQPGAGAGYNGYPGQQFRSPNVHYGGYTHSGFGQQMAGPRPTGHTGHGAHTGHAGHAGHAGASRFPSVGVNGVGVDGYQMSPYDPNAGYYSGTYAAGYGGVGAGVGAGVQQQHGGGGRGGAVGGRKMW